MLTIKEQTASKRDYIQEKMLKLREELLSIQEDRMHGRKGYSIDDVASMMCSEIKKCQAPKQ